MDGLVLARQPRRRAGGPVGSPFAGLGVHTFQVEDRVVQVPQPPEPRPTLLGIGRGILLERRLDAGRATQVGRAEGPATSSTRFICSFDTGRIVRSAHSTEKVRSERIAQAPIGAETVLYSTKTVTS